MKAEEITEAGLWATVPLMDKENVGKYVWADWNGNRKSPSQIVKIGRTNIHCGRRPSSYRVDEDGMTALGSENDFSIHAYSNQFMEEHDERRELSATLDRLVEEHKQCTLEHLRWVVALLNGEAVV